VKSISIALSIGVIGLGAVAAAQAQSVAIAPVTGHPQAVVTLAGAGFAKAEAVDVYIDTTDTLLLVTNSTGAFNGSLTIPAAAQPGTHFVTAIGRHSGDAAQQQFTVTTGWTQFGYGAGHLGWNPYENTITAGNAGELGALWNAHISGSGDTPAVQAGMVFAGSLTGMRAYSAGTGKLLWQKNGAKLFLASPALSAGVLYAGTSDGFLYAMAETNGAQKWAVNFESDRLLASPTVVGNVVYVASYGGRVWALNASTGAFLWGVILNGNIEATPVVVDGVLFVGAAESVYALDASTGATEWTFTTNELVQSAASVTGGTVYVGSDDGNVYALRAATGSLRWQYATGGPVYGTPAVANGHVYVGTGNGKTFALDATSGNMDWSVTVTGFVRGAAVADDVVYFTSNDTLFAYEATYGQLLGSWVVGGEGSYLGTPAVSDGVVYVDADTGYLTAFSLLAGTDIKKPPEAPDPASLRPDPTLPVTH
jgi:outer membrane protein assembly factor BamB